MNEAAELFNKRAEEYHKKFMNVEAYSGSLDVFCERLPPNAEVLEIACGPGNITRYLLNKRKDLNILGTDLAPRMLEIAARVNPEAQFEILDGREIKGLIKKYDGIMCGFCFPYFTKEEVCQFIEDAADVLATNGVLYISTMEDDYANSRFQKGETGEALFIHYHEYEYIREALVGNGFIINDVSRQKFEMFDGMVNLDLMVIANLLKK